MTAIQRFALHGTIMNPHSSGPYVRHEDHLAAMQGRCLAHIEEPAGAAPAAVAGPAGSELDWDVLPENPGERARFDRQLSQLYGGDPRVFIATSLRLWAETRGSGFFGAQCAVFANEIAKMHIAAPALEAPAAPMSTAEACVALAVNSALHRIQAGNAAGAIEPLEQARAALAAVPQAPAAPLGRYKLADDGAHQYLDGIEARYSIEREDGTTVAWVLGNEADAKELMAAIGAAPAAPAVDAETIHLQDLKNALAECTALRQQLTLMDEQQAGSVWRWQADGQDQLASMGNRMGVLIYACDLRALLAGAAPAVDAMSQAARDVLAERRRQVNAEGFSPERDDQYVGGQLAGAATSYLILAAGGREDEARAFWPWRQEWLKPGSQRRYLEKTGALVLAEMERLDRAATQGSERP